MNHTSDHYAAALQEFAAACAAMEPVRLLDRLHFLTTESHQSRPTDWVIALQFGPVTLYQPLEGGRCEFAPLPNRHIIIHRVRGWPLALVRALVGRMTGRWMRRRGRGHPRMGG
jgi:hypothetical protein